jgi:hypothetical protein
LAAKVTKITVFILLLFCLQSYGQVNYSFPNLRDSLNPDTTKVDTLNTVTIDTLEEYFPGDDSVKKDTLTPTANVSPSGVKSKIKYTARDSMFFDVVNEKLYLYGDAKVDYEDITLTADYIEINYTDHTVYAEGYKDSLGNPLRDSVGDYIGLPVFTQGSEKFFSHTITYNFDTKKGKIGIVTTKEGDGYIHGEVVKKDEANNFYIRNGRYTTCDKDTPDYFIQASRLKVIQNNKIITGPAYLVIEDVPFPIAVPFGIFPSKSGRSSGIIIPTYGDSPSQGFYLQKGGYYFGLSDYMDLALRGDIYTYGSWELDASSQYINRYHYTGNFDIKYSYTQTGDPEVPSTFSSSRSYFITWNHTQDPKANPGSVFSAKVNFGSTSFFQNTLSTGSEFLTNTFASSISYQKDFIGTPFHFSADITHSQNDQTKEIDLTAPDLTFTMSSIYPFKSANSVGEQKWYEKIGISESSVLQNNLTTYDSVPFKSLGIASFANGVEHTIPLSTSFKVMKYFTLTPTLSWTDRWYLQSITEHFYGNTDSVVTDTVHGFRRAGDGSASANLSTTIYGMYNFRHGDIVAIRHVMTPSISFTYRPDFSTPNWGYYNTIKSTNDTPMTRTYSYYQNGIYGAPSQGKVQAIGFNLDNNLEMKVKTHTDTSEGTKKIKLLESLSINGSYNYVADSLKLSHIALQGRTTLFDKVNISASTTLDPYFHDTLGQDINKYQITNGGKLGTLTNANITCSFNLNPAAFKSQTTTKGTPDELAAINKHPNDYVDFKIPWSLNVSYGMYYTKNLASGVTTPETSQTLNFSGDLKLTPKWKIGFTSGYDFVAHDLTYTSLTFYRDLHCWEMHLNWVPFGSHQSYSFQLNVKSSILQDLKLVKKKDWYDNTIP